MATKDTEQKVRAIMHTETAEGNRYKNIKEKNWIVYYYLLSLSHYNGDEDHRFVYREEFNIAAAARDLKISRTTFYTSLEKLEKAGLIKQSHNKDFYTIPIRYSWPQLSKNLLNGLLGYSNVIGIDLLRTYLFLIIYSEKYYSKKFTRRNLIRCLGRDENNVEMYRRVEVYLTLLESWNLVNLRQEIETDELGEHVLYSVVKVYKTSDYLDRILETRIDEANSVYGLTKEEENDVKAIILP